MEKITIVILHFLGKDLTYQCLHSIEQLECKNLKLEVMIVNTNPRENLRDLANRFKKFIFLDTKKNLGFTGGNNFGIRKALENKSDFVLILNNDTIVDKNFLIELLKTADSDKKIGILGSKIYFAPGCEFHQERYQNKDQGKVIWYAGGLIDWSNIVSSHRGVDEVDHGQYDSPDETDFVSGCAMLVKKEVFQKIGLFDEKYFLYWEDVDLCQRAKIAGFMVIFVPQAKIWHVNAGSSEIGGKLHDYYMTRNRLLFGFKYALLKTKMALLKESLKKAVGGRYWQKIGIRDFYFKKFGQGSFQTHEMIK